MSMGSVNIAIKRDAYEFLKSLKDNDKSFSDVILELKEKGTKKKGSKEAILRFFGILKKINIDWKAKEERMKSFRREIEERLNDRA